MNSAFRFASREVMVRVANPSGSTDDAYAAGAVSPLLAAARFDGDAAADGR